MTASIYRKTLRDLREPILVWSLGLAALGAANILFFPAFERMPGIAAFLDNLPPALKAVMGDVRSMVTPAGFLRVKLFEPLPLLLCVFGVPQAAQLLAGEAEAGTIDLLLAQPVARPRVVVEKFLAVATGLVAIAAATAAGLLLAGTFSGLALSPSGLLTGSFCSLPLTWLFSALALLGSCAMSRSRRAALAAGGVVVASYVLETLRVLSPALDWWKPLSPFAHQKAALTTAGEAGWSELALLTGISVLLVFVAVLAYRRRDVTT